MRTGIVATLPVEVPAPDGFPFFSDDMVEGSLRRSRPTLAPRTRAPDPAPYGLFALCRITTKNGRVPSGSGRLTT
jgi:hypothetical protein